MRTFLKPLLTALAGGILSSCMYDPYYPGDQQASVTHVDRYAPMNSGSYTTNYIQTYDDDWGYDPQTYLYFQYSSRRYYDPYQGGFYRPGYIPARRSGRPPSGWHPGIRRMHAPSGVRNRFLSHNGPDSNSWGGSRYGSNFQQPENRQHDFSSVRNDDSNFRYREENSPSDRYRNRSENSRWMRNDRNGDFSRNQAVSNQPQPAPESSRNWNQRPDTTPRESQRNAWQGQRTSGREGAEPPNRGGGGFHRTENPYQPQPQPQPQPQAPAPAPQPDPIAPQPSNPRENFRTPAQIERQRRQGIVDANRV